jgi:two-component system CheB/CheR fusion protein
MAASIVANRLTAQGHANAADARKVESLVKEGIDQSRQIARGLLLETVKPEDLVSELKELASTATHQHRTPCVLTSEGAPEDLDENIASHLYYIAREALRNALRHGEATKVAIHFNVSESVASLTITDNGRGLTTKNDLEKAGGMGLHIMSQRAELIGGRLLVGTAPGGGTLVDCRVALASVA